MTGDHVPATPEMLAELDELIVLACDQALTDQQVARLEELVVGSAEAGLHYVAMVHVHAGLLRRFRDRDYSGTPEPIERILARCPQAGMPSPLPPSVTGFSFLGSAYHGTAGFFAQEIPFSLLIATVICGLGLLIGSVTYVTHHSAQLAKTGSVSEKWQRSESPSEKIEYVGLITGAANVKWTDPEKAPISNYVVLGRTYDLASGLMEITYDTGARVILQGPVIYKAESASGGYLSLGKLVGKVEMKKARGFAVRTPTAVVTDLGTEFGVEVDEKGTISTDVFRGTVSLQMIGADPQAVGAAQILSQGQSAQVNRGDDGKTRIAITRLSSKPVTFVRQIPEPKTKMLDLVDVVAGGDGFGAARNRGIDPLTGGATDKQREVVDGDHQYHRVKEMPFVDGVFIPCPVNGAVQLDSALHMFNAFSPSENRTANCVWAGSELTYFPGVPDIQHRTQLGGIDYSRAGHGVLSMHANLGITFDLDAIRRANPGYRPVRFLALAANTEIGNERGMSVSADIWVFVDGRRCESFRGINASHGVFPINVVLGPADRFLTLVATDAGDGILYDWTIFGDPRLKLVQTIPAEGK